MDKNRRNKLIGVGAVFAAIAVIGGTTAIGRKLKKNKEEENIKKDKFVTGRVRRFGTLYLNNVKQKRPLDFITYEDIPTYCGEKIEIRDSDKENENKLSWVEINENNKKLLICDRNILKGVSWNNLNDQNLVFGKVVIIEGRKYLLRLLSGGNYKNDEEKNEWNDYILNINNTLGLPISNEVDKNEILTEHNLKKQNGDNNSLWHWYEFCSFTQNTYSKSEKFCTIRGFYSTISSNHANKESTYKTVGYRPVLEVMD